MSEPSKKSRSPIDFKRIAADYPANKLRVFNFLEPFGVIYVDNPQAGSSAIKLLLDRLYSGADWYNPENVHADRLLPPFRRAEFAAATKQARPWIFSLVRHPERRLLTVHADKMRLARFRKPINEALGRSDAAAAVSLEDFVAALRLVPPGQMNPQWRPQSYNLMMRAVRYDHIGRLDVDDRSHAPVLDRLGLTEAALPRREARLGDAPSAMTSTLRDAVRQIYAEDFETFGFD